jgi:hypothetical protein
MTFSTVAADVKTGDMGIAVASKFPGVEAVVPWRDLWRRRLGRESTTWRVASATTT